MTARPEDLTDRPPPAEGDVLSDVLQAVRLAGEAFFVADFTAPWAVASPPGDAIAPAVLPRAECFAMFHVVTEGACTVELDGARRWPLEAGDVLVLPRGDAHALRAGTEGPPRSVAELLPAAGAGAGGLPTVAHGGGGARTRLVCGYLACDHRFNPLVAALPRMVVARTGGGDGEALVALGDGAGAALGPVALPPDAAAWFGVTLRHALAEASSRRAGGRTMLGRLVELLFLETLRACARAPAAARGWLAAVADPVVGRALAALHRAPARPWTLEELARAVGASRSVLAERFTAGVGEPPMRYLARWRTQLARALLAETDAGVAEVAGRVGYDSEAAFTRAFRRIAGEPPSAFRRRRAAPLAC